MKTPEMYKVAELVRLRRDGRLVVLRPGEVIPLERAVELGLTAKQAAAPKQAATKKPKAATKKKGGGGLLKRRRSR
jgi:hypothetical protein